MRKIAVLTGTRADYGLLKPIMKKIKDTEDLELQLIVTGMHLQEKFGYTINEIIQDGFNVTAKVEQISGIKIALEKIKPDFLIVLGDRYEMLVATIAAAYMNIPIAHIHGGDISGHIDEPARHAITKFTHLHFPATEQSAKRILRMGEEPWRINIVGAPCMDTILNEKLLTKQELENEFEIDLSQPLILMAQHSVSSEGEKAGSHIKATMNALNELKHQTIFIYPNNDAGIRKRFGPIDKFSRLDFVKAYQSLPHKIYLSLMKYATVLVGNSSSGIIESPAFKLPVVNIGTRQAGRQRANNVIDVNYNKDDIIAAIKKAISPEFKEQIKDCKSPYGDGHTAEKIVEVLKTIPLGKKLMQKKWVDNNV